MRRRAAHAAFWAVYGWFGKVCDVTGHRFGCALVNNGPVQWAWRWFGHYGEFGFQPRRQP